jgi:DNA-binding transcriptional MocR family regulator
VEDTVWAFLDPDAPPPLAAFAPERVVLVDSLSKRLSPGLTVGLAVVPPQLVARVAAALRSGSWTSPGYPLAAVTGWLGDGTTATVVEAKLADARRRQAVAAEALAGLATTTAPQSYFCWWELPAPWRADTFVAAAARHGIAVTPAASFAVGPHRAPAAVRIGLASPPPAVLRRALRTLAELARSGPDASAPE